MSDLVVMREEVYPTDIESVNSRFYLKIDFALFYDLLMENMDELKNYGYYPQESLIVINWLARRMVRETGIYVMDFVDDEQLEAFYEKYIQPDSNIFIGGIKETLKDFHFKATVVFVSVLGDMVALNFGATDATRLRTKGKAGYKDRS